MVRTVLWRIFLVMIAILIIMWFLSGGIGRIKSAAAGYGSPQVDPLAFLMSFGSTTLPWGIPIPRGPDISGLTGTAPQAATFGNPSPYANSVSISSDGAMSSDPQAEYIVIQNNGAQTLDITGWSLQSALTRAQSYIPRGASFFALGAINQQNDIQLAPGGTAVVTTGVSPVGTSFRMNECSGYLGQLQNYTPPIQTNCPAPSALASQAAQYGQSCANLVSSLPACTFPQNVSGVSPACQTFVQTNFSYNGCVQAHQVDPVFATNDWRIYLGASQELWNNTHDTVRLLDGQGQVVAVISY